MPHRRWRVPLKLQVGAVATLFVAALVALWSAWSSVVAHEVRQSTARERLSRAGQALTAGGGPLLAEAPRWPIYLTQAEWDALDAALARQTARVLGSYPGVEGGYYLRDFRRFIGAAFPTEVHPPPPKKAEPRKKQGRPPGPTRRQPPPRELDLIEIQVDAAIRRNEVLYTVEEVEPSRVAIRTAPVVSQGRVVGATWVMIRLIDPYFLNRSIRSYRLASALALSGIGLALALTVGLARTVQAHAGERERLQLELRRSERLAALGKLLAGVAHEVRNPLAGIRSTAQLWQRGLGPDEESLADLIAEVDRLDGIVARLLQFSRADAQHLAPGDLNAVVAEVARLTRGPAAEQGVAVETDLAPALPRVMMAAPALVQVFRNLASNALQVMPRGGTLRFATRLGGDRRSVEVEVADTGPGIAPEVAPHLFEPFFTTKPEGTGLGLAIAREIALAHRGDLRAASRPSGGGAAFTLTLPAAAAGAAPLEQEHAHDRA